MSSDSVFGLRIKYHGKEAAGDAHDVGEETAGASMDTVMAVGPRFHLVPFAWAAANGKNVYG